MILPVTSTPELLMLEDETDICENCDEWMLLTNLECDEEEENYNNSSNCSSSNNNNNNNKNKLEKLALGPFASATPTLAEETFEKSLMSDAESEPKKQDNDHDSTIHKVTPTRVLSKHPSVEPKRTTAGNNRSSSDNNKSSSTQSTGNSASSANSNNKTETKGKEKDDHKNNRNKDNKMTGPISCRHTCESNSDDDSYSDSASAKSSNGDEVEDDSSITKVDIPNKFDVLCGQSRICANHTGNRRFQVVLEIYAHTYEKANTKQEKMALTKEIVACIASCGGKFLKYIRQDGVWQEIPSVAARDKVSHALRTKVASLKRQKEQELAEELERQEMKEGEQNPGRLSSKRPSSESSKMPNNKRKTHRQSKRRRSSSSIATSSFDASTSSVMDDLLRSQREIFANLTQSEHSTATTLSRQQSDHSSVSSPKISKGKKPAAKVKSEKSKGAAKGKAKGKEKSEQKSKHKARTVKPKSSASKKKCKEENKTKTRRCSYPKKTTSKQKSSRGDIIQIKKEPEE